MRVNDKITHLQIEPTSICDLKCCYCVGQYGPVGVLSTSLFFDVVSKLDAIKYVQLQGEGEPFVHPNYLEMLNYLRNLNIPVGLITNGRHFTENAIKTILSGTVKSIGISMDSCNPKIYEKYRGGDLNLVLNGLNKLISQRGNAKKPDLYLAAVLFKNTFAEFEDLVNFSKVMGLSLPSAQPLQMKSDYLAHYTKELREEKLSKSQIKQLDDYLKNRSATRKKTGLKTYYEDLFTDESDNVCPFVRQSLYIRFNGFAFPCCFIKDLQYSYGQVGDDGSTSDIWFGEIREEIINIFESGGIPEMCKDCEISNNFAKKID